MKNILILFTILGLLIIGCGDKSNPTKVEPIGGGNVTFQVSIQQNQQGDWYFLFIPSVNVKLTKIDVSLNNQPQETVMGDSTTTYTTEEGFSTQASNPSDGEEWTFTISGKIASDNKEFTATVNYTIPQGTGSGTEDVTFQVSVQQDQQGASYFVFNPSVDIKFTKLDATLNGQPAGTINGDGTTIYTVAQGFSVPVVPTSSGEEWVFVITGKIASNDKIFTSTVNYTIP